MKNPRGVFEFDPMTGKSVRIHLPPEELEAVRKSFHDRFCPDFTRREVFAMRVKATLEPLMKTGAILTMPQDGYRVILADFQYNGFMLWWHEAFGRDHILQVDGMQHSGPWRQMMSGQTIVATVGPLEGEEDAAEWRAWKEFLQTEEGRHVAASIAEQKAQSASAME